MAMLTMRASRFLQRTGRNLGANGNTSIRFDMSKVECYNCHIRGHFARECRSPKDTRRNVPVETHKRNVPVQTSTFNAFVSQCDGVGSYYWSFQAEEEPTNYALMAFTSSSSSSSDNEVASCFKACTKAYATLQFHYDKLTNDLRKSQFDVLSYKTGLESVEARILVYQQNETVFEEDIKLLKFDVTLGDNALVEFKKKFEKAEQERDELKLKLEKFQTSLKNLSQLLASQTNDKTGLGYANQVFSSFVFACVKIFSSKSDVSMPASPVYDRPTALIIEDWVSNSEDEFEGEPKHKQNAPSFVQTSEHVKTPRPSVTPVEHPALAENLRKDIPKSSGHSNSRNRKACFVCKSLTHLIKDCDYYEKKMVQPPSRNHAQRGNRQYYARMTLPNPQRHVIPTAVLTGSKLVLLTNARPVTIAVPRNNVTRPRPTKTVFTKPHSPPRRTINRRPSPTPSNFPHKVTTVKTPRVNAVKGVKGIWIQVSYGLGLKETLTFLFLVQGDPHHALKEKGVINSAFSRHMTRNMSYLSDFEEINCGYVAFGENPKGGKFTGKDKIRTGKLEFDDVYFIKELKFNLFSVLQMCDEKNSVLFTDTECIVLSSDFKLPDENYVLLRVPRENNMYNVDLKNIVPSGDLTFLFAKATLDESNLWYRRLGHIKFKTMNKLVKCNLFRGLPSKVFENNHTCVACKKGKQHRASWIKREFSVARTPQQNGIAERKNRTLIEAARTMLADSLVPISFWSEAVNTACYVQIGFMRPFGCPITILNTIDPLGKFDGKVDEGFLVGYSVSSIQEHFDVDKAREGNVQEYVLFPIWSSGSKSPQNTDDDTTFEVKEPEFEVKEPESEVYVSPGSSAKTKKHDDKTNKEAKGKSHVELSIGVQNLSEEFKDFSDNSTNEVNAASTTVPAIGQNSTNSSNTFSAAGPSNTAISLTLGKSSYVDPSQYPDDPNMPALKDITYSDDEEDIGVEADFLNLETTIIVSPIPTTRVYKDHPVTQIIDDLSSATQTRSMTRMVKDQGGLTQINNEDFHTCMFAFFLSQEEPKRVHLALKDPSWIKAIQEKLLQFKMQKEEGIDYEEVFAPVPRIEAIRLFLAYASFMDFMVYQMDVKSAFLYGTIEEEVYVCQHPGFEDPDYPDKVYKVVKALYGLHQAPRAWYETLANYLLENSFQMGKIDQTLFIKKQKGDIFLVQVYVDEIIFGFTNEDLCKAFEKLIKDKFQMSSMGKLTIFLSLQVKQKPDGIFISQDKYVAEILRKFGLINEKSASTPIDTEKPLLKDPDGEDVDVHTYRSMIGSLMYLTSSRPDIMFAVCACARFQVTPKASHLHAVKRIFRYLKGKPHLGLWYPKDSPFNLVAYTDSDYAGASLDRKSTTGGCQFLGYRLISWQCKKHTVVATSSTEAEYVTATSCCAQVIWIQNQLLDYGYNFMHTTIYIDNSSTIWQTATGGCIQTGGIIAKMDADEDVTLEEVDAAKDAEVAKDANVYGRLEESQAQVYHIDLEHVDKVLSMQDDEAEPAELKEVIKVVTTAKIMTEVVTSAATTITAAFIITVAPMPMPSAARRRKGVVIRDLEEKSTSSIIVHSEPKSKYKGKGIMGDVIEYVKRKEKQDNAVFRYQALKRKPQTKAQAKKNMMVYLKTWLDLKWTSSKKSEKELEEEASKALKRTSKSLEQQAAKKKKLDEEVEELKTHLQIVPNYEDDVYTEATPLALKVPVVDYQIHTEHNKPYYKIIRADRTHQLFISFISLLRNFDKEDLEMLWHIV
nr:hypothetical protein [Tanacetum cinerariifolium]